MKSSMLVVAGAAVGLTWAGLAWAAQEGKEEKAAQASRPARAARQAGMRGGRIMLGVQAWTFHKETLFEAIDHAKELGLKYIELIPSQALSPEDKSVKFDESASDELIKKVQARLKEADVQAISYGVVRLKDEAEARKSFEFAKKMGIKTITAEPPQDAMKMVDKLANEYEINVAIHNHPKPSHYWSPETVLEAIKGCGKRVGACADTGHWTRSGLDPLECLKKLDGHVLACHFKDLNEKSPKAHDVVWGQGVNQAKALLEELRRQKFAGPLMIEYEHNWGKAMPELKECIRFFRKTMQEMRGQGQEQGAGKKKQAEEQ